jgi:hypothetical protein
MEAAVRGVMQVTVPAEEVSGSTEEARSSAPGTARAPAVVQEAVQWHTGAAVQTAVLPKEAEVQQQQEKVAEQQQQELKRRKGEVRLARGRNPTAPRLAPAERLGVLGGDAGLQEQQWQLQQLLAVKKKQAAAV